MNNDWKHGKLIDAIELKRGYDLPQKQRIPGKVPIVSSSGFSDKLSVAKVKGPGVVTGRYGTIGTVYYVEGDFWPLNTTLYVRDFKGNDPRFIAYFLRGIDFHAYSDKAAVPGVNRNHLHEAAVTYPGLPEQRAIASILGALDDKIDLNRHMNDTLEAMARALFKDWFVDFGPTRAKMEGREPYLAPDLWSLFPDRLDDEGKPEGWASGRFGDVIVQRTERVKDRRVNVLSALSSGELVESDDYFKKRVYSKDVSKYLLVEQWDIAYNPSRINIGSVGMLKKDIVGGVSPVYVVLRPDPIYRWFLAFSLHMQQTKEWVVNLASGSVRQSLPYAGFASIPCVIPSDAVLQEFDGIWKGYFDKINANLKESELLSSVRDLLLPKLMSGEIRVREAERIVEDSV